MNHIDDDVLADYVLSEGRDGHAFSGVATHLNDCEQCHIRFRGTVTFFEALTTQEVWQAADRRSAQSLKNASFWSSRRAVSRSIWMRARRSGRCSTSQWPSFANASNVMRST
jgi:hypothetical protein